MAILTTCYSLADLYAVIHASSILFRAFVSAKQTILLAITLGDLGSCIRDAVTLLLTDQLKGPQDTRYAQASDYI
jgi:hypothetical protein